MLSRNLFLGTARYILLIFDAVPLTHEVEPGVVDEELKL